MLHRARQASRAARIRLPRESRTASTPPARTTWTRPAKPKTRDTGILARSGEPELTLLPAETAGAILGQGACPLHTLHALPRPAREWFRSRSASARHVKFALLNGIQSFAQFGGSEAKAVRQPAEHPVLRGGNTVFRRRAHYGEVEQFFPLERLNSPITAS